MFGPLIYLDHTDIIMYTIVTPVYNCESYIARAIDSVLCQNHSDYRMIIVDDMSTDNTWDIIQSYSADSRIISIKNGQKKYALGNFYDVIHSLPDEDIVLHLDGDDQLIGPNVLNTLDNVYDSGDVWVTYGSFEYDYESRNPDPSASPRGFMTQLPADRHNRTYPWVCTHLRTHKSWIFKLIKKNDLMMNGEFYKKAPDLAMMWPMVEMAGPDHAKFIYEALYLYNAINPNNEVKVSIETGLTPQQEIDLTVAHILARPVYRTISKQEVLK